jgi:hypothetical protein
MSCLLLMPLMPSFKSLDRLGLIAGVIDELRVRSRSCTYFQMLRSWQSCGERTNRSSNAPESEKFSHRQGPGKSRVKAIRDRQLL